MSTIEPFLEALRLAKQQGRTPVEWDLSMQVFQAVRKLKHNGQWVATFDDPFEPKLLGLPVKERIDVGARLCCGPVFIEVQITS